MKLTGLFTGDNQISDTGKAQVNTVRSDIVNRQIQAMIPGQTIQGEVVSRNGSDVQIRMVDDIVLLARLERNINLEVGMNMTFEVKNNGKALILSPLFTNVATDANVLKALNMASLPLNGTTISMTQKLMEAGLPIDRNTLQQVYREINMFPEATSSDIVNLHQMQIPVNESNVTQMVSYRNLTHQLVTGLTHVLDAVPEMFSQMIEKGDTENAVKLYQQLTAFVQETSADNMSGPEKRPVDVNVPKNADALVDDVISNESIGEGSELVENTTGLSNRVNQQFQNLCTQLQTNQNSQGIMTQIHHLLREDGGKDILEPVLNFLKNQWTITPEEVANSEKVESLYNRLDKQLKSLMQTIENADQSSSSAYKAVSNLTQNLDFLQQVNQLYTYVQLPLRLQQGEAHGELYVYTNKKHLTAQEGQISALLHLDMEYLGPVDVYVSMMSERVNTKFYLQDDEMLDFMMEHMDILMQRLQKRGYQCDYEMQVRTQEKDTTNVIRTLLKQEQHVPLAEYAFDVRT